MLRRRNVAFLQMLLLYVSLACTITVLPSQVDDAVVNQAPHPPTKNEGGWLQQEEAPPSPSAELERYSLGRQKQNERQSQQDNDDHAKNDNHHHHSVILVATVDGNLAGLSKTTGKILWKKSMNDPTETYWNPNRPNPSSLLAPLVSTTTTTRNSNDKWRTAAVPSIDGSVFLTAIGKKDKQDEEVTVTTTVHDLLARVPFVDARGRVYTGTKHSTAFAVDGTTGEILKVISIDSQTPVDNNDWNNDNIVWLGRVDHKIALHDPRSGDLDVQFSAARIMSVSDMILGNAQQPPWQPDPLAHSLLLNRPQHLLSYSSSSSAVIATPNGNIAYRNSATGQIAWVAEECFETPVAFAIDLERGASLGVDIVPDAVMPYEMSPDYLTKEMERQMHLVNEGNEGDEDEEGGHDTDPDEHLIIGSLSNGELFALPLGKRRSESVQPHRSISMASTAASSHFQGSRVSKLTGLQHSSFQPDARHGLSAGKKGCHAGSASFPECLVHSTQSQGPSRNGPDRSFLSPEQHGHGAVVPFYHPDYGYIPPKHYYTLKHNRNHRRYQRVLRVLGSWLPPTVALIFVVSFELGRRRRQQGKLDVDTSELAKIDGELVHTTNVGVIQVFDDMILGYGGHGTVVYKGMLEGREVAVKRMLKAYHASAEREISLLIESDGHPNVVRYFLKDVRGDFVYLALELCDLSLHDLISALHSRRDQADKENIACASVSNATRRVLYQISCGVKHLHHLRIVHRDLKPMNILLADIYKKSRNSQTTSIYDIYDRGEYIAKISDMGLGKQLVGQSSYGASMIGEASLRGQSNGAHSSFVGAGPGSVGWQAPEVMAMRPPSDFSVRSDGSSHVHDSLPDASPIEHNSSTRTSRSVDIFSLGCIFYSTLLPGCHPFGEWYEREANIMHNRPRIDALEKISPEAHDLVASMIQKNPIARPTAQQVCDHPFFWPHDRRLAFLSDFSDRIETEAAACDGNPSALTASLVLQVEKNAVQVVGVSWDTMLHGDLLINVQRFRTYDPSSVRDLLRLIRNKHHHFDELPSDLKEAMKSNTDGLVEYFEARFPSLLIHCFRICRDHLSENDPLSIKFSVPHPGKPHGKRLDLQVSTITEVSSTLEASGEIQPDLCLPEPANRVSEESEEPSLLVEESLDANIPLLTAQSETNTNADTNPETLTHEFTSPVAADAGDIIIWEASTAAKTFNCRGWSRSDEEWERRMDATLRKRDANLVRCAEDPRFRTRLCNHWDASFGTSCPMLKKKKCIFAHGPVELRVKENKRNRWGKLVDENGDYFKPNHSGGEDTYGAARSIENERKQEGKWNVDGVQAQKGKKVIKRKQ